MCRDFAGELVSERNKTWPGLANDVGFARASRWYTWLSG
jgi:hypothetical protein